MKKKARQKRNLASQPHLILDMRLISHLINSTSLERVGYFTLFEKVIGPKGRSNYTTRALQPAYFDYKKTPQKSSANGSAPCNLNDAQHTTWRAPVSTDWPVTQSTSISSCILLDHDAWALPPAAAFRMGDRRRQSWNNDTTYPYNDQLRWSPAVKKKIRLHSFFSQAADEWFVTSSW